MSGEVNPCNPGGGATSGINAIVTGVSGLQTEFQTGGGSSDGTGRFYNYGCF